jgi:hypothetical protein
VRRLALAFPESLKSEVEALIIQTENLLRNFDRVSQNLASAQVAGIHIDTALVILKKSIIDMSADEFF